MSPEEKLLILKRLQANIDETIEISQTLLELSERFNKNIDTKMVNEHMNFLEKRKEQLKREAENLEKILFS
jgi:hypothetical protein